MSDDSDSDIEPRLLVDIAALHKKINQSADDSSEDESSDDYGEEEDNEDIQEQLNELNQVIALNEQQDFHLMQLQAKIEQRLAECRTQLETVREKLESVSVSKSRQVIFRPRLYGIPYFRDKDNRAPPLSVDAICRRNCKLINHLIVNRCNNWSYYDKRAVQFAMLDLSRARKIRRLEAKLLTLKSKEMDSEIRTENEIRIRNTISIIQTASLSTVAPPIEFEFNWEEVAELLHNRHSAFEVRSMWKLYLHPSLRQNDFNRDEYCRLESIAKRHNYQDWATIAREFDGRRSEYQCFVYFRTVINNHHKGEKWTVEEDEFLRQTVEMYRIGDYIPWPNIAASFQNKNKAQVYNRYMNSARPQLKKGKFLPEEDAVIFAAVEQFGQNFGKVAQYLPGRTAPQVRLRYNLSLVRRVSAVWSVEEDRKLMHILSSSKDSLSFAAAAEHFPNKDRVSIRMRYITLLKWFRANPNMDLRMAPRRGPRIISRAKRVDLRTAVDNLVRRLDSDATNPGSEAIDPDINKEFHKFFMKIVTLEQNVPSNLDARLRESTNSEDTDDLRTLLLMLRANLIKQKFWTNNLASKHDALLMPESGETLTFKVRTYSRKPSATKITTRTDVSVWNDSPCFAAKFLMPMNYQIINACRTLMLTSQSQHKNRRSLSMVRAPVLKQYYDKLLERCEIAFTWCLYLSCIPCKDILMNVFDDRYDPSPEKEKNARLGTSPCSENTVEQPSTSQFCIGSGRIRKKVVDIENATEIDLPKVPETVLKSKVSLHVHKLLGNITSIEGRKNDDETEEICTSEHHLHGESHDNCTKSQMSPQRKNELEIIKGKNPQIVSSQNKDSKKPPSHNVEMDDENAKKAVNGRSKRKRNSSSSNTQEVPVISEQKAIKIGQKQPSKDVEVDNENVKKAVNGRSKRKRNSSPLNTQDHLVIRHKKGRRGRRRNKQ